MNIFKIVSDIKILIRLCGNNLALFGFFEGYNGKIIRFEIVEYNRAVLGGCGWCLVYVI